MSQYETQQNSTDTLEFTDSAIWAFYQDDDNSCEVLHTRRAKSLDEEPDPPPDDPGT